MKKIRLGNIQLEVISSVFGLFFSFNREEIFLEYIAPIIRSDPSNFTVPLLIDILAIIIFTMSIVGFIDIIIKIQRTQRIQKSDSFLFKIVLTFIVSLILAFILQKRLLN